MSADLKQYQEIIEFYETIGRLQSEELLRAATGSYKAWEIGYFVFLQNIDQVFQIELGYLENLKGYNQSIININYLKGNK